MSKKLFSLILALLLVLTAAVAVAASVGTPASTDPTVDDPSMVNSVMTMYVYTDNGRGLNVRSSPYVGNNIIGLIPYGSQVQVTRFLDNGWASIVWNVYGEAYVQSRFLQWYAPAPVPTAIPTAIPTAVPTAVPTYNPYYPYSDPMADLNAELRTARMVTPFTVSVRPSRSSGWVNMRWAPSKDTEVMNTYRSGALLTVIAETQNWYQAEDPSTGATGFIMKSFVVRQY